MSISKIQYNNKKEEFIQKLVQKGIEPNNFELNKLLTEHFDKHVLGTPYYSPIKQKPYEESSKEDYNHNFQTFYEDITTIFKANIEANNKAVAMQEYYDTQKTKVINAISKINLRADNILYAIKNSNKIKQNVEVFDDLYNVEFYGDDKRNIPFTTAFIDLLQKNVHIEKMNSKVNKLSIVNATININEQAQFSSIESKGVKENILSDIISDTYILICKSKDDKQKTIELVINLQKLMTFNTVLFRFSSVRNMLCTLMLSDDGVNYTNVYDISSSEMAEWNFNSIESQYIKIICSKDEPDGLSKNGDSNELFEYYFLLNNISIANEEYSLKSTFVSKPIEFNNLISTLRLDADDIIFNNTRIDYFIGFDNGTDKVGWDHIPNHEDYELYMFQKVNKIANFHLDEYADSDGIYDMYSIIEIPDTVNYNSIKVVPAYNMWSIKKYNRITGDYDDRFSIYTDDYTEFIERCNMTQLFMDCENYELFRLQSNVLYIFTQFVSLEESANLYNRFIKVKDMDGNVDINGFEIRVFINEYEMKAGDNNLYSFNLRKGTNKIQITLYCPSQNATDYRLYHNINFKELTNDVFGMPPMKYTSNSILDKVVGQTYQYYTIRDNKIYVKCDPANLISNRVKDMGYFVRYSTLREDLVYYFKNNKLKFRIMAVLNSNNRNVSPRILNYRITGR